MSNLSDWISWAATQDSAGTLPALANALPLLTAVTPTPPAVQHGPPDSLGLVNIPELGTGTWAVEEIEDLVRDNAIAYHTLTQNIQNARFCAQRGWAPYDYVLPAIYNSMTDGYQLDQYHKAIPGARVSLEKTVAATIERYKQK